MPNEVMRSKIFASLWLRVLLLLVDELVAACSLRKRGDGVHLDREEWFKERSRSGAPLSFGIFFVVWFGLL
jgi:hypothetical protein